MYRHYQCYCDILLEHDFDPIPIHQYWEMKRDRVSRRQLLALSNAIELYEIFLATWMQRIESREYLDMDQLQYGVVDILSNWKKLGVRLVLATMRNNSANVSWQLKKLKIAHFFDALVVVGSDARKSAEVKPVLNNVSLEEVIWIGDTEVDINAARELGVKVCALTCGLRTETYLASLSPDVLEKDLSSFVTSLVKI